MRDTAHGLRSAEHWLTAGTVGMPMTEAPGERANPRVAALAHHHRVAYLRGGPEDETGPEMADAAMAVLADLLEVNGGPDVEFVPVESGVHCHRAYGASLPPHSLATILELGVAFKAPNASAKTAAERPTSLILRRELGTYASVNHIRSYAGVKRPLRSGDIDIVLVRDNSEGLFGVEPAYRSGDVCADLRVITRGGTERLARIAFGLAADRRRHVTVCAFPVGIPSDRLFIETCEAVAAEFVGVELHVRKVDAFAGTVISSPDQYDVVLAPNEWGSIITDALAAAAGSVGLTPRANLGDATGYFEPIHGTAPGKTGKGTVNPVSQILAGALLLAWLGRTRGDQLASAAATRLQRAVADVLASGDVLTVDIGGTASTADMVAAVSDALRQTVSAPLS